jgi:hypothetical protein
MALLLGGGFVVMFVLIKSGKINPGAAKFLALFGVIVIMIIFVFMMGFLKTMQR